MPDSWLLIFGRIAAANVRQAEIVVGIPVTDKRRHVVRLAIHLADPDNRDVIVARSLIVADEQIRVSQTAGPKEIGFGGTRNEGITHTTSPCGTASSCLLRSDLPLHVAVPDFPCPLHEPFGSLGTQLDLLVAEIGDLAHGHRRGL